MNCEFFVVVEYFENSNSEENQIIFYKKFIQKSVSHMSILKKKFVIFFICILLFFLSKFDGSV